MRNRPAGLLPGGFFPITAIRPSIVLNAPDGGVICLGHGTVEGMNAP